MIQRNDDVILSRDRTFGVLDSWLLLQIVFCLSKCTPFGRPFPNSLFAIGCLRHGVAMKSVGIDYLTVITHTHTHTHTPKISLYVLKRNKDIPSGDGDSNH